MIMMTRNSSSYNQSDKPLPIYKVRDNSMNSNIILKPRPLNTNVDLPKTIDNDVTQTNFYTYNMIDSLKHTKSCTSCGK